MDAREFSWEDGERVICFGEDALREAPTVLARRGFTEYALLTTPRARQAAPGVVQIAAVVLDVPSGPVPQAAATVRDEVQDRPLVALGGGRVIDSAKAIAGADGLQCAAVPTTLSGAEMTPFHRMPAGVDEWRLVRPEVVIAAPSVMASQPLPDLAASAMNALAHAIEALYTPMTVPEAEHAGLDAASLISDGLGASEPERRKLALGALLAGYASGVAGFAVHHAVCQTIVRVCGTPHAQTNAVMLPHFVGFMEERAPGAIEALAAAIGAGKTAAAATERVTELRGLSGVATLGEIGVEASQIDSVVTQALQHPALGNTPGGVTEEDLRTVLEQAL